MTILPANRMPRIFDSALGRSFSSTTCPQFFDQMLTNKTFTECFPMSFYLQSSSSYVATIRSATNNTKPLEDILDTSCNGISSFSDCTAIMNDLAQRMMQNATCGLDHQRNNSNVVQAYSNLVAYPVVYQTTCLKTDVSNSPAGVPTSPQNNGTEYCYINALYNEELASESFSVPAGSRYFTYEGAARVIDQTVRPALAPPDLLETEEKNNSKANAGVRTAHPTSIVNMLILSLFLSAVFTIL
ncbi:hypothetical protein BD777DRAFT_132029 [Yarrowia lipolytica]|nr:hypothetical protein BD777DRAFT_132029 [Yarrowia lipolytica]